MRSRRIDRCLQTSSEWNSIRIVIFIQLHGYRTLYSPGKKELTEFVHNDREVIPQEWPDIHRYRVLRWQPASCPIQNILRICIVGFGSSSKVLFLHMVYETTHRLRYAVRNCVRCHIWNTIIQRSASNHKSN